MTACAERTKEKKEIANETISRRRPKQTEPKKRKIRKKSR
jgi:hypothetical protein